MSDTGTRQRKSFDTKKLAELTRNKDLERHRLYGVEGHSLHASKMADAAKALEILEPLNTTLTEAARHFEEWHKLQSKSQTLKDAWQIRLEESDGKSDKHLLTIKHVGSKVLPKIGDLLVSEIGHDIIRKTLSAAYATPHGYNLALRTLRPVFRMAVNEGWALKDPCERLKPKDTGRHEIRILDLNQSRKLMMSCKDYRKDESMPENLRVDARGAVAAIAIALFSGVRPGGEIERLEWGDVDMLEGTIFISNQKAKTDRSRFFTMPETLKLWLATIPATQRYGNICTANWKRTWQAIRRAAGISDLKDATRKTFATMHLAHFKDVNLTRSIMGHEAGDVLFQNYRGLATPKDARAFWEILPTETTSTKVRLVSIAAK